MAQKKTLAGSAPQNKAAANREPEVGNKSATRKTTATELETSDDENPLRVEDVRAAVLRLVELAAAFEGRGYEVSPTDSEGGHADDLRVLAGVTDCLLKNLKRSRRDQRDVVLNTLIQIIGEVYRDKGNASESECKNEILARLGSLGIIPTENQLKELVKFRSEEDGSIRKLKGPIEAAKAAIAKATHVSVGTTGVGRRRALELPFFRAIFGRWITFAVRKAYVVGHFENELQIATQHQIKLHHLGEIDHSTGAALDYVAEKSLQRLSTKDGMTAIIISDSQSPNILQLQRQFLAQLQGRCGIYAALADADPDRLAEAVENSPEVSGALRKSIFSLVHARKALDEQAIATAMKDLILVLADEVIESGSDNFAALFGPLRSDGD